MAEFDESKVINALHTDKAEVGKKYWFSDSISRLKERVEKDDIESIRILTQADTRGFHALEYFWEFIYPYEEPPKPRMTYRQLAEWLAKGNGEYADSYVFKIAYFTYSYAVEDKDIAVADIIKIRPWDSEEWVEPTVDIYERDCKKE